MRRRALTQHSRVLWCEMPPRASPIWEKVMPSQNRRRTTSCSRGVSPACFNRWATVSASSNAFLVVRWSMAQFGSPFRCLREREASRLIGSRSPSGNCRKPWPAIWSRLIQLAKAWKMYFPIGVMSLFPLSGSNRTAARNAAYLAT
jgi:hypothetical protein